MSAAAPAAAEGEAPKKGSKKLIIIIVALVAVLLIGGGAAAFMLMSGGDHAEATDEEYVDEAPTKKRAAPPKDKKEEATPPTFVPLDPFVVNLADRDAERFAQIGITLQIDDPKIAEEIKLYMPAIRNSVLLILSHKTAAELLTTEGKIKLADEIGREAARAMGYEIEDPEEEVAEDTTPTKRKRRKVESYNPITHVHYANFIIQ